MFRDRTERRAFVASMIAALLLAGFDFWLPMGFGGGFPYVPVVLLSLLSTSRRSIFITAAVCTFLATLAYLSSSHGFDSSAALGARMMAIGCIWMTTLCCFHGNQLVGVFDEMLGSGRPMGEAIDASKETDTSSKIQIRKGLRTHSETTTAPIIGRSRDRDTQPTVSQRLPYETELKLRQQFDQQTRELTLARHRIDELSNALTVVENDFRRQSDDLTQIRITVAQDVEAERARYLGAEQSAKKIEQDLQNQLLERSDALAIAKNELEASANTYAAADQALSESEENSRRLFDEHARELDRAREQIGFERTQRIDSERNAQEAENNLKHRIDELSKLLKLGEENHRRQSGEAAQARATAEENVEIEIARSINTERSAKKIEEDLQNRLQEHSDALAIAKNELEAEAKMRAVADQALIESKENLQRLSDEHGRELAAAREQMASERTQHLNAEREARTVEENLKHRIDELTDALNHSREDLQIATAKHSDMQHALNQAEVRQQWQSDERLQELVTGKHEAEAENARCAEAAGMVENNLKLQIDDLTHALATANDKLDAESVKHVAASEAFSQAEQELRRQADKQARELAAANEPTEAGTSQPPESHGHNERDLATGGYEPAIPPISGEQNHRETDEGILHQAADRTTSHDAVPSQTNEVAEENAPLNPPTEIMDECRLPVASDEVGMIEDFVGELLDQSYAIRQTLRDQDFEALKTLARDLVTPAERCGYTTISQAAKELETMATAGQLDELTSQVKHLRSLCELGVISHGLWSLPRSASTNG